MLISRRCRFVLFPDPMGSCHWMRRALEPWLDQPVAKAKGDSARTFFFRGMSPAEAELAFDMTGHAFRSYTRIAIVQNPYRKMAQLYDRIAATDRVWRTRHRLGLPDPNFGRWLHHTRADGTGAGYPHGPRWRRFGAWSADAWCDSRISHIVRADTAKDELDHFFRQIGISPAFACRASDQGVSQLADMSRYNATSTELIRTRYKSDLRLFHTAASDLRLVA